MEPVQQPFHSIGAAPSIPQPLPGTGEPPLVPGAEPATAPPPPPSKSVEYGGRIYSLEVVQQPIRARMCGFGDKVGDLSLSMASYVVISGPSTS